MISFLRRDKVYHAWSEKCFFQYEHPVSLVWTNSRISSSFNAEFSPFQKRIKKLIFFIPVETFSFYIGKNIWMKPTGMLLTALSNNRSGSGMMPIQKKSSHPWAKSRYLFTIMNDKGHQ